MTVRDLALWLVVVLGAVGFHVVAGVVHDRVVSSRRRRVEAVSEAITQILIADDATAATAAQEVIRLPRSVLVETLQRLAADLDGSGLQRLRHLAHGAGITAGVERSARSRRWRRRLRAAQLQHLLPDGHPRRRDLLSDRRPEVASRAMETLSPDDALAAVDVLLVQLGTANQAVQFAAQQALLRCDSRVTRPLVDYLSGGDRAGTNLALEVAANLPSPELLRSFRRHAASVDPQRRRMVALSLASGCVVDADVVLADLLGDPDEEVRAAAAQAAGRVGAESLATRLGRCLSDPSWNVRRAAGGALEQLGAVGALVLRVHLGDDDLFARDMARQSLDAMVAQRTSMLPRVEDVLVEAVDDWVPSVRGVS